MGHPAGQDLQQIPRCVRDDKQESGFLTLRHGALSALGMTHQKQIPRCARDDKHEGRFLPPRRAGGMWRAGNQRAAERSLRYGRDDNQRHFFRKLLEFGGERLEDCAVVADDPEVGGVGGAEDGLEVGGGAAGAGDPVLAVGGFEDRAFFADGP
jgi:hypothetical protein